MADKTLSSQYDVIRTGSVTRRVNFDDPDDLATYFDSHLGDGASQTVEDGVVKFRNTNYDKINCISSKTALIDKAWEAFEWSIAHWAVEPGNYVYWSFITFDIDNGSGIETNPLGIGFIWEDDYAPDWMNAHQYKIGYTLDGWATFTELGDNVAYESEAGHYHTFRLENNHDGTYSFLVDGSLLGVITLADPSHRVTNLGASHASPTDWVGISPIVGWFNNSEYADLDYVQVEMGGMPPLALEYDLTIQRKSARYEINMPAPSTDVTQSLGYELTVKTIPMDCGYDLTVQSLALAYNLPPQDPSTLQDPFNGSVLDTDKWKEFSLGDTPGGVSVADGKLKLAAASNSGEGVVSRTLYTLMDLAKGVYVEVDPFDPDPGGDTVDHAFFPLYIAIGSGVNPDDPFVASSWSLSFAYRSGNPGSIACCIGQPGDLFWYQAGNSVDDPEDWRYLRIYFDGVNQIFWQRSRDAYTWTNVFQTGTDFFEGYGGPAPEAIDPVWFAMFQYADGYLAGSPVNAIKGFNVVWPPALALGYEINHPAPHTDLSRSLGYELTINKQSLAYELTIKKMGLGYNLPPRPIAELSDDFEAGTIDPVKWQTYFGID